MNLLSFTPTLFASSPSILRRPSSPSPAPPLLAPPPPYDVARFRILYHRPNFGRRISSAAVAATADLARDSVAAAAVLAGAYGLVFSFDSLTQRNLLQQSLSRKLVHILSGLLYMVSWPIFSTSTNARYFALLVPLVNCTRLLVHGLSLASDQGLIKSMTREGNPEELLRGPLYYVLVLIVCTLVFWRESPVGVIALSMMCGGDGVADIMGRKYGSTKIPYNQRKSWAGSISMFFFGFLVSIGMLYYYSALGYFQLDWPFTLQRVALASMVATIVESLPISEELRSPRQDTLSQALRPLVPPPHPPATIFLLLL